MNKPAGKVLLILAVCFVICFAVATFLVNSWLRQSLKEETAVEKQPAAALKKSSYSQTAMGPAGVAPEAAAGVQKKSTASENLPEAGRKETGPRPMTGERILNN